MPSRSPMLVLALSTAIVAAACDSAPAEPPDAFPYASATPECGPADGPAVAIFLRGDSGLTLPPGSPYVRIYLWHGVGELDGERWTVGGGSADGAAAYEDGSDAGLQLEGTVTITGIGTDSSVMGEVDLQSAGTFAVRGGFRARWIPRTVLCG